MAAAIKWHLQIHSFTEQYRCLYYKDVNGYQREVLDDLLAPHWEGFDEDFLQRAYSSDFQFSRSRKLNDHRVEFELRLSLHCRKLSVQRASDVLPEK